MYSKIFDDTFDVWHIRDDVTSVTIAEVSTAAEAIVLLGIMNQGARAMSLIDERIRYWRGVDNGSPTTPLMQRNPQARHALWELELLRDTLTGK